MLQWSNCHALNRDEWIQRLEETKACYSDNRVQYCQEQTESSVKLK